MLHTTTTIVTSFVSSENKGCLALYYTTLVTVKANRAE